MSACDAIPSVELGQRVALDGRVYIVCGFSPMSVQPARLLLEDATTGAQLETFTERLRLEFDVPIPSPAFRPEVARVDASVRELSVIVLDVPGGQLALRREDVTRLRHVAAAQAGRSSAARDLSLLLDRALAGGRVALRRSEVNVLIDTASGAGLTEVAGRVQRAVGG